MKITFKADTLGELREELRRFLNYTEQEFMQTPKVAAPEQPKAAAPKSKGGRPKGYKVKPKAAARGASDKPVEKLVEKPAKHSPQEPVETSLDDLVLDEPEQEPVVDATHLAAIRIKTTEDLQAAYSSGKHKQVLELLATYGNGAKSFRELALKDFIPIRKAIDAGALQ